MFDYTIVKCMAQWVDHALLETKVLFLVSRDTNIITGNLEVTYIFTGYTITIKKWEFESMYTRLIENKNLSEIECARLLIKQKLKDLIKNA